MGASNFEVINFGKSIEEAYRKACNEATWECGHDPYNGTISTTQGFITIQQKGRRLSTIINAVLENENSQIQKWGPCGAIVLKGRDAKQYRERHNLVGKKGVVVLFFGWAAC